MSTGLSNGLALPHARIAGVAAPLVVVGLSQFGIDFDSPDGRPVRVVVLLVTAPDDHETHLQLVADVARVFQGPHVTDQAAAALNATEFVATLNTQPPPREAVA